MDIDKLYAAANDGDADSRAKLEMEADRLTEDDETILHIDSEAGNSERVRFIVREFSSKNLLVKQTKYKQTALHLAAYNGHIQVAEILINAARHLPPSSANDDTRNPLSSFQAFLRQGDKDSDTALHAAVMNGHVGIVKLLVEADPSYIHIPNGQGKTPIYIAAEKGYIDIVKLICTTCTALSFDGPLGATALHAAIENMDKGKEKYREVVIELINAAKRWGSLEDEPLYSFEDLFNKTDFSVKTVLDIAVEGNHGDIVELILREDPAYQHGRRDKSNSLQRLIYTAANEKYYDIFNLLSETYEVGISTTHKGLMALFVAIGQRDKESVLGQLGVAKHLATCADHEGWTPLHCAAYYEFDSVLDAIVKAQEDVGFQYVYEKGILTPIHIAAENGYTSTLIRLMQLWPASKSLEYMAVNNMGQNILHLAAIKSEKEMIKGILKYCSQKHMVQILNQQDPDGNTPLHLLISFGCFIPELLRKRKSIDMTAKNNESFTPLDMLYFQEDITADQVQIKDALDDIEGAGEYWKFWRRSIKRNSHVSESLVLPSRRWTKDAKFIKAKKMLMIEKQKLMEGELERYKKRTNIQIIVTALITTVTFTVGFTMPGGLHSSGELNQGFVLLSRKTSFNAFMVADALALLLSTSSLFFYFLESMNENPHQVSKLNAASSVLNIVSVMAMMLTFITGTYVVLSHSAALAITVCIIGSLFFLFVIILLIKMIYDRQLQSNED